MHETRLRRARFSAGPPRIMRFKLDFDECRYALQEPVPSALPGNLHSAPAQTAKSSHLQLTNDFTVITRFVRPITPLPEELPRRRLGLGALMPTPGSASAAASYAALRLSTSKGGCKRRSNTA